MRAIKACDKFLSPREMAPEPPKRWYSKTKKPGEAGLSKAM